MLKLLNENMHKKNKFFFMHLPKCGGTSIINSIKKSAGKRKVYQLDAQASKNAVDLLGENENLFSLRSKIILYMMATEKYDIICGHTLFSNILFDKYSNDYSFITLIRDPVSRFISHYFYNRYRDTNHFKIDVELEEFLTSERAMELGQQYLKYFSGVENINDMNKAKENILKFDIIGNLDEMKIFTKIIKKLHNIKIRVGHENLNPKSKEEQKKFLSKDIIDHIIKICEPDIELYEYIMTRK